MQTNLLLNVLASLPGMAGLTPPSTGLLGTTANPAGSGTIGGQFAGLLGQPGKQSDLALLSTNNPTGDIETSPQVIDIASLGGQNLPGLATYIDSPTPPVLLNQTTLATDAANTIDSKKAAVASQLAMLNKANISKDAAQVASDVANKQVDQTDFQSAIKKIQDQKLSDGKIQLSGLDDVKTTQLTANEAQNLMAKATDQLNDATVTQKQNQAAAAAAQGTDAAASGVDATADSNSQAGNDLLNKLKTIDPTKTLTDKTSKKTDSIFSIDNTSATAAAGRVESPASALKDVKIDSIATTKTAAEQVEVKIAQMVKDGVDMVRIKLHPEDLGKIDIHMDVDNNGQTSIRIIADKSETLDLLRKDSGSLERALKDTGVRTDSSAMQFSLRDQNQQQQNFAAYQHAKDHSYSNVKVNDNYLKAANVNEYTLTINPQKQGVNILA